MFFFNKHDGQTKALKCKGSNKRSRDQSVVQFVSSNLMCKLLYSKHVMSANNLESAASLQISGHRILCFFRIG